MCVGAINGPRQLFNVISNLTFLYLHDYLSNKVNEALVSFIILARSKFYDLRNTTVPVQSEIHPYNLFLFNSVRLAAAH